MLGVQEGTVKENTEQDCEVGQEPISEIVQPGMVWPEELKSEPTPSAK